MSHLTDVQIAERLSALETTSDAQQQTLSEISATMKKISDVIAQNQGNHEAITHNDARLDDVERRQDKMETRIKVWVSAIGAVVLLVDLVIRYVT